MPNKGRIENLLKAEDLTSEQLRARASKGGKASVKAKRERKLFRETLEEILSMPLDDKAIADLTKLKNFKDLKGQNVTVQTAILLGQVQKAMKGDRQSAEYIRDTIGQKPKDNVDLNMDAPPIVINNNVTE